MSSAIAGKMVDVKTVEGEELTIDGTNGVMVNNARVTKADIDTSNGVIHVVDTALIPTM
jgi:uncharacterized surface protein with fasciclin (FAS1) repeats